LQLSQQLIEAKLRKQLRAAGGSRLHSWPLSLATMQRQPIGYASGRTG
jgi:hypothetical protein